MRLAEERGLRVVVQIYLDSAPDWVGEKYPGGRFVDRSGAVIISEAARDFALIMRACEARSSSSSRPSPARPTNFPRFTAGTSGASRT